MSNLTFRPATEADIPLLLPLIKRAYRGEEAKQGWTHEADLVADERIDAAGLREKITHPEGVVLVGTDPASGNFITCCEVLHQPHTKTCYFGLFAVEPKAQGGGIGKKVMAYAEQFVQDKWAAERMEMTVIWMRDELIAWYGRRGYVKTGERREFPYEHLVNGVALRDDLWFEVLMKDLTKATP